MDLFRKYCIMSQMIHIHYSNGRVLNGMVLALVTAWCASLSRVPTTRLNTAWSTMSGFPKTARVVDEFAGAEYPEQRRGTRPSEPVMELHLLPSRRVAGDVASRASYARAHVHNYGGTYRIAFRVAELQAHAAPDVPDLDHRPAPRGPVDRHRHWLRANTGAPRSAPDPILLEDCVGPVLSLHFQHGPGRQILQVHAALDLPEWTML